MHDSRPGHRPPARAAPSLPGLLLLFLALAVPGAAAELEPCAETALGSDALCTRIQVPEDRTRPEGRVLALRIVVLPAQGDRPAPEPVFLLAGGPGQGAIDLAPLVLGPLAAVREVRDVVLVDTRGTGGSGALVCETGSAEDARRAFGALFDRETFRACAEALSERADLRLYSTQPAVDDLETVRTALGYERVVLWGGSGGTRTAQVWARRYPEAVAAMALDGVTPNDFRAPSGYARWVQDSLERLIADCATQPDCHAAFPDLAADVRAIVERLDRSPVEARVQMPDGHSVEVTMSRGDFGYALRGLLYNPRTLVGLPAQLHRAAVTGDLSAFAQALWQRDAALRPIVSMGVHLGVFCNEDVPFIVEEQLPALTENTVLGRYLVDEYRAACELWPHRAVDSDFLEPVHSDTPTLLVSGHYDPSTPATVAERVKATLPNSRHLVIRDQSHGAEFGCALPAMVHFLKTASLHGLPEVCADAGPLVFKVPASGDG